MTNIQIVTGAEVTIENCFPEVWEILPNADEGKEDHTPSKVLVGCSSPFL